MKKFLPSVIRSLAGTASVTMSKLGVSEMNSFHFLFMRNVIMLLFSIHSINTIKSDLILIAKDKKLLKLSLTTLSCASFSAILFYLALGKLPLSIAGTLESSLHLLMTTLVGMLFFKTTPSKSNLLLTTLLIPSIVLLTIKDYTFKDNIDYIGVLIISLSAFLFAVDTFFSKRLLDKVKVPTMVFAKTFSVILMSLFISIFLTEGFVDSLLNIETSIMLYLIIGAIVSFISNVMYPMALKAIGPNLTVMMGSLTQIFVVITGIIFFNDELIITQWIGLLSTILLTMLIAGRNR